MKKEYAKPQIVFDSFELSQSIAAGCEYISNHALGSCGLDIGSRFGNIFIQSVCEATAGDGEYNGICYHVPSDSSNVFSS